MKRLTELVQNNEFRLYREEKLLAEMINKLPALLDLYVIANTVADRIDNPDARMALKKALENCED